MSQSHQSSALQSLSTIPRQLHLSGVLQLQAQRAGWLRVDGGRVWLTRRGDRADHVLAGGEAIALGRGEVLLVEPWRAGETASLLWAAGADQPAGLRGLPATAARARRDVAWGSDLAAGAVLVLARALRGAAGRLAAAARSAEAIASRAQGSINAGDSIASSGALQ